MKTEPDTRHATPDTLPSSGLLSGLRVVAELAAITVFVFLLMLWLCGCVHVARTLPTGERLSVFATGNAVVMVSSQSVTATAVDTAATYDALGRLAGTAVGAGLKAAVAK